MKFTLLGIVMLVVCACSKGDKADLGPNGMLDADGSNGSGDISIRIWNDSKYSMENMYVDTGGGENDYGTVKNGQHSFYRQFNSAYRYAFVSFKINGKAFTIQPLDYVGETPLKQGKYTYRIMVENLNSPYAYLEFIEED
ncbi:hypothetical protein LAG90_03420 [Marinilongibacter aquaticus]|uniref:hypothetical protein n=1 Tax=Marinilongibacter aquaticus TaxID=2975157 RepID=UPI0021BD4DD2|nr:hypothetical protein [Marinilongibacter aquaticus]UBM59698.1 hypothetical protein LAG90_03420 [Marinilongibacter aquaticus]